MSDRRPLSAEEALAHSDWVGRLARALTDDASDAEDLAQDTWEASAKGGRELSGDLGAWLTGVLRKLSSMRARSEGRRRRREVGQLGDQMAPGPDELLERLETQRVLAQLVAELPEPVRLVLFLRYYEGLSSAQIAAQLDVPAGTVRWRLKSGVDALRARLDERFDGDRSRWLGLVLPLAPRPELASSWLPGVIFMKANKLVVLLLSLFALLGWWLWPSSGVASMPSTKNVAQARTDGGGALTTRAQASPSGVLLPAWLGQPEVAPRRVAGRVLLEGAPLAGARVRLEPEPLPAGQRADERVTGEDGTFDFGPRPALMHTVSASAPGRTGDVKDVDLRDPTAHPDSLELRITGCAARLVGHVLDSARGPIEHAQVRPARGLGVESNGRGEFELCVSPGSSSLHVDAEGYGPLSLKVLVFGRTSRDIVLIPEAVIVGRVVDLETGAPVAGALVIANPGHFTGAEAVRGATVVSGADGRFQLPVAPGDFAVTATLGSGSTWPPAMVSTIVGRLSDETVLRMRRQSRLRGVVQSAGKPIAGARVTVFSTSGGGRRPEAWSQEDGRFVIQGAPLGPVMFAAAPFAVVSPQRVVLSKSEEEVTLEVKPQGSFHGLVTKGGKPVAGASVKANAGFVSVETSSDAEGRYALKGLAPGRYYRLLAHSEVAGGFVDKSGEVLGEREERELNLELSFAASIAGRVVSADGTPVEGAMVLYVLGETGDEGRSVTDADGRFLCQQLTGGGAYEPSVFASATAQTPYAAAVGKPFKKVSLADGSSHAEGVTLSINYERKVLRGRVVEASGAPAADVILRAEATQPGQEARFSTWVALPRAVSDAQGVFAFEPLPGGPWTVHARAPDGAEAIVPNLPTGGGDVLITLRPPAGIEGTLDGYEEPPAAIYARPLPVVDRLVQGHLNGSTFRLVLPAGTYLVSAMNAHEGDVQRVEVKEGETTKVKLQSHGRARLTGSVVDYSTGAPVAGLICHVLVASDGTAGITRWDLETAPHTDEKGLFSQDPAPAGPLHVSCVGDWNELSTASALVSVEKGGQVNVPLAVVRKVPSAAAGDLGLAFDDMLTSGATAVLPVIRGVRAGSVAARAGVAVDDLVVAMDGRPIAPLDASGVEMLIINHPPGSKLVLSVLRGGQRLDFTMLTERVQR